MDRYDALFLFVLVGLLVFAFSVGHHVGKGHGKKEAYGEAVKEGHGDWVVADTATGKTKFEWRKQ